MKQTLALKLSQRLTLTPQLKQSLRLLQLSALDLRQELHDAATSNPLLELADTIPEENSEYTSGAETPHPVTGADATADRQHGDENADESYDARGHFSERRQQDDSTSYDLDARNGAPVSSRERLRQQISLIPFSPSDRRIAEVVIDSLDEAGYLDAENDEIARIVADDEFEVSAEEIEVVIHQLHNLEPVGIASRSLGECLALQLAQLDDNTPGKDTAIRLLDHLALLAKHDFKRLRQRLKISADELRLGVELIQHLDPRPGEALHENAAIYVVPDVLVFRRRDEWRVELNPAVNPALRVNQDYKSMLHGRLDSEASEYLKTQLQEARWFMKSVHSRYETILRVARAIVQRQQGFLHYGEAAMKPLVMREIAEELGMHESTVSRATTQKYMLTPRGTFELKYFFSSRLSTVDGEDCSATAIQSQIRRLIEAESGRKPLSDNKIADLLHHHGFKVARRTIAKYREQMNIPPSSQRKALV